MGNSNSGRGGLPPALRREIERRLLARREANVDIARSCGVNVSTVQRIKRKMGTKAVSRQPSAVSQTEAEDRDTVRCAGCGASVLMTGALALGYCFSCYQEKTVFAAARRKRIERLARRNARRSQKARIAA